MTSLKETIRCRVKMNKMTMSIFGRSQYNDWKIIMTVTTFGLFMAAIFGFCLYINFDAGDFSNTTPSTAPSTKINKEVLNSVLEKMGDKQKNFEILKNSKPLFKDPSLY
ncbi:MAG: hypothetical protein WCO12_03020 [bacterium]